MPQFKEQEQQRRIQKTAVEILKNEATFINGGWSDNTSGVPKEADKDTFSITLGIENCDGCAPADVADRINEYL